MTLRYLRDNEELLNKAGIKDTFSVAQCHYLRAVLHIDQQSPRDAEFHLNEVDRICQLLGEDKEAKSFRLEAQAFATFVYLDKNDHDKVLEIGNSILQRIQDINQEQLLSVLTRVYQNMGVVYKSRKDVEKTIEFLNKGVEVTIKDQGEKALDAFNISNRLSVFLGTEQPGHPKAIQFAKKTLQIALKIFSKDSLQVGESYLLLAALNVHQGNDFEALTSYLEALPFYEKQLQDQMGNLETIYFELIRIYGKLGDPRIVATFLARADQLIAPCVKNKKSLADKYFKWAQELSKAQKMDQECKTYFEKALEFYKSEEPQDRTKIAQIYQELGWVANADKGELKEH